jgi:hypothetical protein
MSNTPAVDLLDKISMYGKKKKGAMRKPERPMSSERPMTKEAVLGALLRGGMRGARGGLGAARGAARGGLAAGAAGAGLLGLNRITRAGDRLAASEAAANMSLANAGGASQPLTALEQAGNYLQGIGARGTEMAGQYAPMVPGAESIGGILSGQGNQLVSSLRSLEGAGAQGLAGALEQAGGYLNPALIGAGAVGGAALGLGRGLLRRGGRAMSPGRAAALRAAGYGMAARPPMDPRMLALAGAGGGAMLAGPDNRMMGAMMGAGMGALGPRLAMSRAARRF